MQVKQFAELAAGQQNIISDSKGLVSQLTAQLADARKESEAWMEKVAFTPRPPLISRP